MAEVTPAETGTAMGQPQREAVAVRSVVETGSSTLKEAAIAAE